MAKRPEVNGELSSPTTCTRCNNRLAFGLARVQVNTMVEGHDIWLCGSCQDEFLNHWMQVYKKRSGGVTY